ncbi:MAG: hypothetical protein ACK5LS_00145 [Propioniciclava sp.]
MSTAVNRSAGSFSVAFAARLAYLVALTQAFTASFLELYLPRTRDNFVTVYGSLWDLAAADDGIVAKIGALTLMAALVVALIGVIGRRWWQFRVPLLMLAFGLGGLTMVAGRPGAGSPPPEIGPGGWLLLVAAVVCLVAAAAELVIRLGDTARPAPAPLTVKVHASPTRW